MLARNCLLIAFGLIQKVYLFSPVSSIMSKRKAPSTTGTTNKRKKVSCGREQANQTTTKVTCSSNELTDLVEKIAREFRKNADPKKSLPMKKYMRDQFEYFGLSSPLRKTVAKEFLQQKLNSEDIREFVVLLWAKPEREFQYFALDYLEKNMDASTEFEANIKCMEHLITTKSWWDTVDALASKMVGRLVQQHPKKGKPLMKEWIDHENMWLRRTALLHQLSYKDETDEEILFSFCSKRADEKEFFIRKAIGWALRQHAWRSSASVKRYLLKNKKKLSALSFKEAAKHLKL
ncbi:uncharacterized protein [Montipora capricornis]|uniref:uncharacterized protein n=1 Tax=Montipora capricornis TaxID=246305 RepID=UPI0035F15BEF